MKFTEESTLTSNTKSSYAYDLAVGNDRVLYGAAMDHDNHHEIRLKSFEYRRSDPSTKSSVISVHLSDPDGNKLQTSRAPGIARHDDDLYLVFRADASGGDNEPISIAQCPVSSLSDGVMSSSCDFSDYLGSTVNTDSNPALIDTDGQVVMAYKTNRHTIGFAWGSGTNWSIWNHDTSFYATVPSYKHCHHGTCDPTDPPSSSKLRDYAQGAKIQNCSPVDGRNDFAHTERAPTISAMPSGSDIMLAFKDNHSSSAGSQPLLTAVVTDIANSTWNATRQEGEYWGKSDCGNENEKGPGDKVVIGTTTPKCNSSGPALAVFNDTLWLLFADNTNHKTLTLASYSDGVWTEADLVDSKGDAIVVDDSSPKMCSYVGLDGFTYLAISFVKDGNAEIRLFTQTA